MNSARGPRNRGQHSTEPGDGGGDRKRRQLRGHDVDAEPGSGPFVAADRNHASARRTTAQIGDEQADHDDEAEYEICEPVDMHEAVELDTEHAERCIVAEWNAVLTAGDRVVLEHQRFDGYRQAQRCDGQADASGARRRQSDDQADGHCAEHPENENDRKRQSERVGQLGGDEPTDARQGDLGHRHLACVPQEHGEREERNCREQGRGQGGGPIVVKHRPDQHNTSDDDEHHCRRPQTRPYRREAVAHQQSCEGGVSDHEWPTPR